MKKLFTLLTVAVFVIGCASTKAPNQAATGELDYGDYTSETLTTSAWNALNAGRYETAIKYTEKCVELYEEKAREMQAYMKAQPPSRSNKSPEAVHAYWALNDVGTSYFIRGEALLKLDKKAEAMAAFKAVMDQFSYAQTWDPKGWFWSPAEAASKKVTLLSNDF